MPNSLYLRMKIKNAKDSLTVSLAENKCSANSYWEMGTIDNLLAWPTYAWTDTPPLYEAGAGAPLCCASALEKKSELEPRYSLEC